MIRSGVARAVVRGSVVTQTLLLIRKGMTFFILSFSDKNKPGSFMF